MKKIPLWLWVALGALLFAGGGTVVYHLARGIRNNNPGNIEKGTAWKGLDVLRTAQESRFAVFTAPEWGIRALARVLKNYGSLYGLDTVRKIINRWAPPSENDTGAYVNAVAKALNVSPDQAISVEAMLPKLIPAIIKHENGVQPYSAATIQQGILLERSA